MFQARFELERLLHQLDRAVERGRTAELGALRTRFDVFWSRVESLRVGSDGAPVRQLPGAQQLLERLQDELQLAARRASRAARAGHDRLAARDLAGFEAPLQDLMLTLNQSSAAAHSTVLQRVRELRSAGWLSLARPVRQRRAS